MKKVLSLVIALLVLLGVATTALAHDTVKIGFNSTYHDTVKIGF